MAKREGQKKTGQKTLRIGQRTQFAVEICAALEKKSETAVIETAIERHAAAVLKSAGISLADVFHIHPGVRALNTYLLRDFPLADDADARRNFVMEHRAFFFLEQKGRLVPNVPNVETLWGKVDEYRVAGTKRYWASGDAMAKALNERGLEAPAWPPKERGK